MKKEEKQLRDALVAPFDKARKTWTDSNNPPPPKTRKKQASRKTRRNFNDEMLLALLSGNERMRQKLIEKEASRRLLSAFRTTAKKMGVKINAEMERAFDPRIRRKLIAEHAKKLAKIRGGQRKK